MALGERDVLSRHVEETFKALGLTHLLVVSGYQVSLVFGVIFAMCLWMSAIVRPTLALRHCATWCAFIGAGGYVALVGAEMSSVRALIAAACLCVALVIDRRHRFAQRWATALLMIQVVYPWALFDIGVLLTFAALGGIGVGSVLGGRRTIASVVWVTVSVWLFTSLITIVWTGSVSFAGLLLNLVLAGPWSVLNCTVGVVGLVLTTLHQPTGEWVVWMVGRINEAVVQVLLWLVPHLGMRGELQGRIRWILVAILVGLSIGVCRKAVRRYPVLRLDALLR
jgi:competence protein ComEC